MVIALWLLFVHDSHRLQAQSYHHATYSGGSIRESGLLVHDCHRLRPQSYLHATRISSIEIALCLQSVAVVDRQATFTDTSTEISSMEVALCLQSVTVVEPLSQVLPPQ